MAVFTGNGAVGSPSFTFSSDTDTGFYRLGAGITGVTSDGTAVADFEPTGFAAGSGIGTYPSFFASNAVGAGDRQIVLNSYNQGVSASAFAGVLFRHQYVTGTSDRPVAQLGFRRANATSGSQLTNFVIGQRVDEGASLASVIETNASGSLLIGGTLPSSPNASISAGGFGNFSGINVPTAFEQRSATFASGGSADFNLANSSAVGLWLVRIFNESNGNNNYAALLLMNSRATVFGGGGLTSIAASQGSTGTSGEITSVTISRPASDTLRVAASTVSGSGNIVVQIRRIFVS